MRFHGQRRESSSESSVTCRIRCVVLAAHVTAGFLSRPSWARVFEGVPRFWPLLGGRPNPNHLRAHRWFPVSNWRVRQRRRGSASSDRQRGFPGSLRRFSDAARGFAGRSSAASSRSRRVSIKETLGFRGRARRGFPQSRARRVSPRASQGFGNAPADFGLWVDLEGSKNLGVY